jgi:transposase-like protein
MKIRSNGRVYRTESEWRKILADYSESGLKLSDYCSRHGIVSQSLSKAQRRYGDGEFRNRPLVEIVSIDRAKLEGSSFGYRVELDLGSSMVLRIR